MNDYILETIGLSDPSAEVYDIEIKGSDKFLHIRKKVTGSICPHCGKPMKSKGWQKERTVKGIGEVGGFHLFFILHQRKWFCSSCKSYLTDHFAFVEDHKQTSNILPYLIARDMRYLNTTAVQLAQKYSVSDTYVIQAFMSVVSLNRLPLPEILCVDEVFLNFDYKHKYPMVLLDFTTGEPIDLIESRRQEYTRSYFQSIPIEERNKVKYLISDMYDYYVGLAGTVFPNATGIVDSFHVISKLNGKIISYMNGVKRRYQKRDKERLQEENYRNNRCYKTRKDSYEVALLKDYDWILLRNDEHLDYTSERTYVKPVDMYLDMHQLLNMFMDLDSNFKYIRDMKEKYIHFNNTRYSTAEKAAEDLDKLIKEYADSHLWLFRDFSSLLDRYRKEIIASFTWVNVTDPNTGEVTIRRLSNGPAEGFNNFPKDLKRISNGLQNFEYARNRILWARRHNPTMLAVPRSFSEFHVRGASRGHYRKHNTDAQKI